MVAVMTTNNITQGALVQFKSNCFTVEEDIFGSRDDIFEVLTVNGAVITLRPLHGTLKAQVSLSALQGLDRVYAAPSIEEKVNQPKHYQMDAKCAYDVIRHSLTDAELRGYCLGNILKYSIRARYKVNMAEDRAKAEWYMARLGELKEG